jgi:hypothetical protein
MLGLQQRMEFARASPMRFLQTLGFDVKNMAHAIVFGIFPHQASSVSFSTSV